MSPSATPATPNEDGCRQVPLPHLPREAQVDVAKRHACHAKCRGHQTTSATPATQNEGGCRTRTTPATQSAGGYRQVPRLPRKAPRHHERLTAPKRATRASPVPQVPHLPRKKKVDVAKCHACHVKRRWMSPSARPATQSATASRATNGAQAHNQSQPSATSATPATQNEG